MKQPRFKFGDLVKNIYGPYAPFKIEKIEWQDIEDDFYYNETSYESALELYQEPQKKKLYAYRHRGRETQVQFYTYEISRELANVNWLERESSYDLEYPEKTNG